jgi:small subunit ribosomal protein S1
LKKGQDIEVQVLDIDLDQKRISLGYKQLHDPWSTIMERYQQGQDVTVRVVKIVDFGAFVEIESGIEGLIHISQISRRHIDDVSKVLKKGDEVKARILEIDPNEKRIRLSIKALEEEEKEQVQREEKAEGKSRVTENKNNNVQQTEEDGAIVTIGDVLRDQFKV